MSYMKPEIYRGAAYVIETSHGTEVIPVDAVGEGASLADLQHCCEGRILDPEVSIERGYLARLSAPGYLDCTSWSLYSTREEAERDLADLYGLDDDGEDAGSAE